jgi:amino acid transporter
VTTAEGVKARRQGAGGSAPAVGDKGLKAGALGYLSNLVIGVASTAPAYSLAATLGFIVAVKGVGTHAPAVLIVSFVPMLLIAFAYRYLNRADPDCGTTFAWTTRALGPYVGWLNGWAIFVADVIVMASLSVIASTYTYTLVGWHSAANSTAGVIVGAIVWIALMTWICYRGIELSARTQQFLLSAEILILVAFAVVAIAKTYTGTPAGSVHVSASWFDPFDVGFGPLVDAVLLGIFIYWGWDSGVAVNEESEAAAEGPGRAAVVSTLILVLVYVVVSTAAQAYGGTYYLVQNSNDVLSVLGTRVFGSGWDKLLIIAVLTSASASTQTTILPTARTTLSMARWGAIPEVFGRIHPRYLTPTVSTLGMGALSMIWTVLIVAFNPAQNVLGDSISALGFAVCFYYGFTGLACAVYFRRELRRNLRTLFLAGIVPLAGCVVMFLVLGKAFTYYDTAGNNYSTPLFGIQVPIVIGIGSLLLGVPLALVSAAYFRRFFSRRPEVAPAGVLEQPVEHARAHL